MNVDLATKLAGRRVIASVSGGKDSVALWLYLRRLGLDPVAVFQDTGWEWDGHYAHLELLEARIGKLHRVAAPMSFEEQVRRKGMFPKNVSKGNKGGRWCTAELKLEPFRKWLDAYRDSTGEDVVVAIGIRRDEGAKRADALEWEWSDFYDCEVWRPLVEWTLADVAAEHHRAAIPMHPLYHHGAERVGCWPCIHSSKAELSVMARIDPERVERVAALERETGATMFAFDRRTEKKRLLRQGATTEEAGASVVPAPIEEVVRWASASRGGRQFQLVREPSGCARWGICEAPKHQADDE